MDGLIVLMMALCVNLCLLESSANPTYRNLQLTLTNTDGTLHPANMDINSNATHLRRLLQRRAASVTRAASMHTTRRSNLVPPAKIIITTKALKPATHVTTKATRPTPIAKSVTTKALRLTTHTRAATIKSSGHFPATKPSTTKALRPVHHTTATPRTLSASKHSTPTSAINRIHRSTSSKPSPFHRLSKSTSTKSTSDITEFASHLSESAEEANKVGAAVGGLVGVIIIILGVFLIWFKRRGRLSGQKSSIQICGICAACVTMPTPSRRISLSSETCS